MRTFVIVAAVVCALAPNVAFAEERDYPLIEAPEYADGSYPYVTFRVLNAAGYPMEMSVRVASVDVRFRTDGKAYTSLYCYGVEDYLKQCSRATILVPLKEDVDVWEAEVRRWNDLRKKFLDGFPRPRRVLPKTY